MVDSNTLAVRKPGMGRGSYVHDSTAIDGMELWGMILDTLGKERAFWPAKGGFGLPFEKFI